MLDKVVNPSNKSILVLSNYRTGSTAFCDTIAKHFDLKNYDEHLYYSAESYQNILDLVDQNQIIFKIQPDQIPVNCWEELTKKCYVIGLERKNILNQIVSFYICSRTQVWHNTDKNPDVEKLTADIAIDRFDIEDEIRYILKMRKIYNENKKYCDVTFIYEDILSNFENTDYKLSSKPNNFIDIYNSVEKIFLSPEFNCYE